MTTQKEFHASLIDPADFTITYELVPGRGSKGNKIDRLLEFAHHARQDGRIKALSITDNAGGHPALDPIAIGSEVRNLGIEPMIHFSLKDKNRNQLESHIFLYHRQHFNTLLVLGGDYPRPSYYGQAKPVFDLDSIQTLQLLRDMETGTYNEHLSGSKTSFSSFSMLRGCVVSPFKHTEAEQVLQYAKLLRKIQAGAQFIVTQLGYDTFKFEELIRFLQENNIRLPVLGNVFIPSRGVARIMNNGGIPGIVFPRNLLELIEEESQDTSLAQNRLQRAAKLICILKGLGYSGVHIGGNCLDFEQIRYVLDTSELLAPKWQELIKDAHFPVPKSWYLYRSHEDACGHGNRVKLHPGPAPDSLIIHQLTHFLLFSTSSLTGKLFSRLCRFCDKGKAGTTFIRFIERASKRFLFYCQMCGDCTLSFSTYLCPQSGCPKKLLNGPCGGSRNSACEVFPDRRCFWVRVYNRLPADTSIESFGKQPGMPPKDWALDQSPSWINYYTGRGNYCHEKKKELE
jgi:methylenetetrahydrofolate reductase (NADPH)